MLGECCVIFRVPIKVKQSLLCSALCASVLSGCMREKDRLDAEVRGLCAKDGGIKVYEEVKMPATMFDQFGVLVVPDSTEKRPLGSGFILSEETKYYRKGNPSLRREHAKITRDSDGKLLGEFTSYHRVGGDWPGPWHDSSFACPPNIGTATLKRLVFQRATMASHP